MKHKSHEKMKEKISKTNACRILDKSKVPYKLVPYEVDEDDLSARHVANVLGENIEQVFKTLVLHGDKTGHLVCVVPGDHEVDLKKVAQGLRQQKMRHDRRKRTPAIDRLHPGRMFPCRHEKTLPDLHPQHH